MIDQKEFVKNVDEWSSICLNDERIDLGLYEKYDVFRGHEPFPSPHGL